MMNVNNNDTRTDIKQVNVCLVLADVKDFLKKCLAFNHTFFIQEGLDKFGALFSLDYNHLGPFCP